MVIFGKLLVARVRENKKKKKERKTDSDACILIAVRDFWRFFMLSEIGHADFDGGDRNLEMLTNDLYIVHEFFIRFEKLVKARLLEIIACFTQATLFLPFFVCFGV